MSQPKPDPPRVFLAIGLVTLLVGATLIGYAVDEQSNGLRTFGLVAVLLGGVMSLVPAIAIGVRWGVALGEWDRTH